MKNSQEMTEITLAHSVLLLVQKWTERKNDVKNRDRDKNTSAEREVPQALPAMTGTSKSKLAGTWPLVEVVVELTCLVLMSGGFLLWDIARPRRRFPLVGDGGG